MSGREETVRDVCGIGDAMSHRLKAARTRREVVAAVGSAVLAGAAAWAAFRFVLGIAVVKGGSMEPTLRNGDVLLLWRLGDIGRGDVVLVRSEDGTEMVKRVVALPGETVEITQEGEVEVDGELLHEEYARGETHMKAQAARPLTLAENEHFVLGDNRGDSHDSRDFGPILHAQVQGRVIAVIRGGP